MEGSKQWDSAIIRTVIFVVIFFFVTMGLSVSKNKSPTMVAVPMRVVPIRQVPYSTGSSNVDDSSVAVSSQEKSFSVNHTFSSALTENVTVIEYNRTHSTTKSESDGGYIAIQTKLTTAVPEISNVCHSVKLMPEGSMPVVALVSLPGSGNTWLRYLIERVTGIYTGSIYNDGALIRGGFLGEKCKPYSGQTVAVKMHGIQSKEKINKTIFLVRNLREALQAEFNRRTGHGHTGVVNQKFYNTDAWPNCVKGMLSAWKRLVVRVATTFGSKNKLLVVHYQDLKKDLSKELRRIVDFLDLRLNKERLQCTINDAEGNFHRPKHSLSFDPFRGPLEKLVQEAIFVSQSNWTTFNLTELRIS